jgi:hypothetical protein
MSLQQIINKCNELHFDRRRVIGIQTTRNETIKTAETPTLNTWKFKVTSSNGLPYSLNRDLLEALDYMDRRTAETITFSNNSKMSWMFAYQGAMTQDDINMMYVSSFIGNELVLSGLTTTGPASAANAVLFKPGDIIQLTDKPYPFTVVETVLRGSNSTVTVKTHRPNIIGDAAINKSVIVGNAVSFRVLCVNMPTYKLVPGAQITTGGVLTNNARIEFSDSFQLIEYTDLL